MNRWIRSFPAALLCVVLFAGCTNERKERDRAAGERPALESISESQNSVAGIQWKTPASWSRQADRPMRVATYAVPSAEGDPEPAELAVFYFGRDQGGGVDANIERWIGQFESTSKPERSSRERSGLTVTIVEVGGTYLAPGGPMMQSQGRKENYRMLAAIVEGPEGPVFFKLTGPSKTVERGRSEFEALLDSLRKS